MRSLTWDQVRARRLARNHLVEPAPRDDLVEMVGDVGGIQAQIMGAAELGIGVRAAGVTQKDVREQLWATRTLVKTYGPRGTLHLLPAFELPMWMASMRAVPDHHGAMWNQFPDITREQVDGLVEGTRHALDGRELTRDELATEVSQRLGSWARKRLTSTWGELLAPAALQGVLCFGPNRGSKVTFVRADQWIGGWREEDPHRALLDVLRRYLAAYGPATPAEFARWFRIAPATARELIANLGDEVVPVDVEGQRSFGLAAELRQPFESLRDVVRLVPHYDCFVLGSRPRERLVSDIVYSRIRSYRRGKFEGAVALPTLLVNGMVTGMWQRRSRGRRIEVTVEAVQPLAARHRKLLEREVARIGDFYRTEATLVVGPLSAD